MASERDIHLPGLAEKYFRTSERCDLCGDNSQVLQFRVLGHALSAHLCRECLQALVDFFDSKQAEEEANADE